MDITKNLFELRDGAPKGYDPFVITTGSFAPGGAKAFCDAEKNSGRRDLGTAELLYYTGKTGASSKLFKSLLTSDDMKLVLSAHLGVAKCSLAGGDIKNVLEYYDTIKSLGSSASNDSLVSSMCVMYFIYFNIMIQNTGDLVLPAFRFDSYPIPESLKIMAVCAAAHYLIEKEEIGRAIGMAESALLTLTSRRPVAEIYLNLIAALGYMLLADMKSAEKYFRFAWQTAEPDGLFMPFAEYRCMLLGLIEKCLRREKPDAYKKIVELSVKYNKRWVAVHNKLTGDTVTSSLSPIEYNVASLAAYGFSNKEIGGFLSISVNSVRAHLRNIFVKLDIGSRKELRKYVI